jgi:hypothetical protein
MGQGQEVHARRLLNQFMQTVRTLAFQYVASVVCELPREHLQ